MMEYLNAFALAHDYNMAAVYAFFRWLSGPNECYVALPTQWLALGSERPRDFAVFNGELLVEYHRDEHIYLHVTKGKAKNWASNWKFCDVDMLLDQGWWQSTVSDLLTPSGFVDLVFGDSHLLQLLIDRCDSVIDELRNEATQPTSSRVEDRVRLVKSVKEEAEDFDRAKLSVTNSTRLRTPRRTWPAVSAVA